MNTIPGEMFPPITESSWRTQVEQELKGASFERTLLRSTLEGLTLHPLYSVSEQTSNIPAPGEPPFTRGHRATAEPESWVPLQRHEQADPAMLNTELLNGLMKGARGAWIPHIPKQDATGWLRRALQGVEPSACTLRLGWTAPEHYLKLLEDWQNAGQVPSGGLVLHRDPLAQLAETGSLPKTLAQYDEENGNLLLEAQARGIPLSLAVSTEVYHNAGAHAVQELGLALASYVSMLRGLEAQGLPLEQVVPRLSFSVTVGRDIFMEAAKLRALRQLWWRVLSACGIDAETARQTLPLLHTLTSRRTLTRWDPWVNMLRVTTQTWAAVLGGAEQVTTAAFDEAWGLPEPLGQRVARNTQLILAEESQLHTVLDPLGGSYYVESLTDALAGAGWHFFQEVERQGGLAATLRSGWLASQLQETASARQRAYATRKEALTGLSEFPWAGESPLLRTPASVPEPDPGIPVEHVAPLPFRADGAAFDRLRSRAWALQEGGKTVSVYVAILGPLAEHHARTMFAQNFFWVGGCEVSLGEAPTADSVENLLRHHLAAARRASVVCLSGSDAHYTQYAVALIQALKAEGIAHIWMAGKPGAAPGTSEAELRAAGLSGALFMGCDVVQTLQTLLDTVGGVA